MSSKACAAPRPALRLPRNGRRSLRRRGLEPPPSSSSVPAKDAALSTPRPPLSARGASSTVIKSRLPISRGVARDLGASARSDAVPASDSPSSVTTIFMAGPRRQLRALQLQISRGGAGGTERRRPIGPLGRARRGAATWVACFRRRPPNSGQSGQPCRTVGVVLVMVFLRSGPNFSKSSRRAVVGPSATSAWPE